MQLRLDDMVVGDLRVLLAVEDDLDERLGMEAAAESNTSLCSLYLVTVSYCSATSWPVHRNWRMSRHGRHGRRGSHGGQAGDAQSTGTASPARPIPSRYRQRRLDRSAGEGAGFEVKVGKFPFIANSKASILDSHDGFVKVVADEKFGEILGVHIIGPEAFELICGSRHRDGS